MIHNYFVKVEAFETIREVKAKIRRSKFFSAEPTLFIAKNALETLDDDEKTVYEYGLEKFFNGKEFILTKFPSNFSAMQIFMETLHDPGNPLTFQCFNFTMIETLKQKIQEVFGIQPDVQIVIFDNQRLKDERTLEDYNITDSSTIAFMIRMLGD